MKTIIVNTTADYPVYIDQGLLLSDLFYGFCVNLNKRLVIITDSNLINNHGQDLLNNLKKQNINTEVFCFPAGEEYKTRETKQDLENILLSNKYGRDTCFIALGGGVVTDLVGYLAATYCRGVPVIYIPTTLLAMVDASIGGKTGVNTPYGKNLIGTFTQPIAVFIDTLMLKTLPNNLFNDGVVEIIKHGLIADKDLFNILRESHEQITYRDQDILIKIIYQSCMIKKNIIEQDEKEQGLRQVLNFGHTIGHAIEIAENYTISHGEAVAIGILVESYLSVQTGFLEHQVFIVIKDLLKLYNLPLKTLAFADKKLFKSFLELDKKAINRLPNFVLLNDIGKPYQNNTSYSVPVDSILLDKALDWAYSYFS